MRKNTTIIILLIILGLGTSFIWRSLVQHNNINKQMSTEICFDSDVLCLGTLLYNCEYAVIFKYTNTGKIPLSITDVRPYSDCIYANWDKHTINPGEHNEIIIVFRPDSWGSFSKSIKVHYGASGGTKILKICGNITMN